MAVCWWCPFCFFLFILHLVGTLSHYCCPAQVPESKRSVESKTRNCIIFLRNFWPGQITKNVHFHKTLSPEEEEQDKIIVLPGKKFIDFIEKFKNIVFCCFQKRFSHHHTRDHPHLTQTKHPGMNISQENYVARRIGVESFLIHH